MSETMTQRVPGTERHRVLIIGGGTAASWWRRLANAGQKDVAILEPSAHHYYQSLWTLVGAGFACVRCGGRRQVLAYLTALGGVRAILEHLELPTRPAKRARAQGPPQLAWC